MLVQLSIDPYDKGDLDRALLTVAALRDNVERTTHKATTAAAPIAAVVADAQKAARAARKDAGKKRGPYKKRATEDAAPTEPVREATDTVIQVVEDDAPMGTAPVAEVPGVDDCRAALKAYSDANGVPAAMGLLREFGVERISDVPPDRRAEFIQKATV